MKRKHQVAETLAGIARDCVEVLGLMLFVLAIEAVLLVTAHIGMGVPLL